MNDVRNMNLSSDEIDFDNRKTIYFARKELARLFGVDKSFIDGKRIDIESPSKSDSFSWFQATEMSLL